MEALAVCLRKANVQLWGEDFNHLMPTIMRRQVVTAGQAVRGGMMLLTVLPHLR